MVVLSPQLIYSNNKVMPGMQGDRSLSIDALLELEEGAARNQVFSNDSAMKEEFNHPHVPSNCSSEELENACFQNRGYETDESDEIITEITFKSPGHNTNAPSDQDMSAEEREHRIQTLSLPEEQQWMETERSAFITKRIQNLVQSIQSRAEKAKEKLVQPPTPSPSPPPDTSSENEPTPVHKPRLRLQSLIEDDKSSIGTRSTNIRMLCCSIKKKFIPTFPEIIDPQSKLYITWLFLVMVSYSYNVWSIILLSVFPYQTAENIPIFLAFDYIADAIYLMDIFLFKVRLQFLSDGFWVEDYARTKANYFRKKDFKLDILSLLPLDLLYFFYGINPLFRLPRFLKVQTFWEFFNRVDAVTKTPYVIRIIRTLMYMMYLIHLNACAYFAMSLWEGIGSNKWVFQGEGNAYIRCFYFATKTATSIGKNPKPENEIEYIFMTISWLMGVFIFAFLVGQIRDIVATATQGRTQYRQLMDQTVMYMRNLNLPDELQRRVRMWLNHNWEQQKTFDVSKILNTLPRKMKTDIAINVHYQTLMKVQLFKDCDKALLRDLVLQLKPVLFLPGDYVCRKGEVGKEMYIVNKGMVEVLGGERGELVLATLTKGSVFGEISLLGIPGCNRRTADVRSKGFSNLFVLGKDDLWEALKNYPEAQKVLRKKAKNIIKENEARARANRPISAAIPKSREDKTEESRSSTPKFVRTVLQLLPKTAHRVQPQMNSPVTGLFANNTIVPTALDNIKCEKSFSKRTSPLPTDFTCKSPRSNILPTNSAKARSMSDGTLRRQFPSSKSPDQLGGLEMKFSNQSILIRASSAKSEPCNYRHPNSADDYSRNAFIPSQPRKRSTESCKRSSPQSYHPKSYERLSWPQGNTDQSLIYQNPHGENYFHFQDESSYSKDSTELSSTQKILTDNSDEENSNLCWTSSSSSIPFLGELFKNGSPSNASTNKDFPHTTQIEASSDKADNDPVLLGSTENTAASSRTSSSTSIPCLSNLFRSGSSNQSNSNKEVPLSPIIKHETSNSFNRPDSSTSENSSVGYDNLAYVPTGILSRRSSFLSDISG